VSHGAIQFTVYEELKSLATRFGSSSGPAQQGASGKRGGAAAAVTSPPPLSPAAISLMGAASKLCASVVTYPSQVSPGPGIRVRRVGKRGREYMRLGKAWTVGHPVGCQSVHGFPLGVYGSSYDCQVFSVGMCWAWCVCGYTLRVAPGRAHAC
jgi:hypothetical protein